MQPTKFGYFSTLLFAAIASTSLGCSGAEVDDSEVADGDDAAETSEALSSGFAHSYDYNKDGLRHAGHSAGVDVKSLKHTFVNAKGEQVIHVYDADYRPIGDVALMDGPRDNDTDKPGPIRIQTLERIKVKVGSETKSLIRDWPRGASNNGWIDEDDFVAVNKITEETEARAGNGRSCSNFLTDSDGTQVRYLVDPRPIVPPGGGKVWKIHSSGKEYFKFSPDWDTGGQSGLASLMWSWNPTDSNGDLTDFKGGGGGVYRAQMHAGDTFRPCKVIPVKSTLRAAESTAGAQPKSGAQKVTVYAAYGMYETAHGHKFYGWTLVAERNSLGVCTLHVKVANPGKTHPALPSLSNCH